LKLQFRQKLKFHMHGEFYIVKTKNWNCLNKVFHSKTSYPLLQTAPLLVRVVWEP